MSLTIYGVPASRAFRVLWAALELELPYDLVPYHYSGPETKAAGYLAINPNGTVPAIVDDGVPLFESLAINLYLARKAERLWPRTVADEGRLYQWTLWAATEVDPVIGQWAYNAFFLPPEQRKPELAAEAAAKLRTRLSVVDGALAQRRWLAGDDFTMADLNVAAVLYRAPRFGIDAWPHLKDWHARCYARPGARAAVALREAKAA
jgi:glutathione S-transferase